MPSESFEIEDFPKDGRRWWIRAVDHVHTVHKSTATPGVEVLLSRIPEELDQQLLTSRPIDTEKRNDLARKILKSTEASVVCKVHVGTFPCLRLGSIFRDGVYNGRLPSNRKTFVFDLSDPSQNILTFGTEEASLRPLWWNPKSAHRVLNFGEYPLSSHQEPQFDFRSSKCALLTSKSDAVILPCSEIFRAFYAPTSEFARALLSGPWKKRRNRIVATEDTGVERDGSWTVILRKEIADDYLLVAANLAVSECGSSAASEVHTRLMENHSKLPATLHARIPFDSTEFTVEVECVTLEVSEGSPAKHLVFEVTSMGWPYGQIRINKGRDNDNRAGQVQLGTQEPPPFGGRPGANERRRGTYIPTPLTDNEDPGQSGGAIRFQVSGPQWLNAPIIAQLPKYLSYKYEGATRPHNVDPNCQTSTGDPQPGLDRPDQASIDHSRMIDAPDRFIEIIECFETMMEQGLISNWETITGKYVGFRNDIPVWMFPRMYHSEAGSWRVSRWSWLEETGSLRAALVCCITISGKHVYWVETEVLGLDGRRAVILAAPLDRVMTVITDLLQLGTQCRAIWPKDDDQFCSLIDATKVVTWRHSKVSDPKKKDPGSSSDSVSASSVARRLNTKLMAEKIRMAAGL